MPALHDTSAGGMATPDWSCGTFSKEALVHLWQHPKFMIASNDTFY